MKMKIEFIKAKKSHLELVKEWWNKPHIAEWLDMSETMWNNFADYVLKGKKDLYDYWIGLCDGIPYSLLLTSEIVETELFDDEEHLRAAIEGKTYSIDFMIGNEEFLGKGLGAATLSEFRKFIGSEVKTFLIDPQCANIKATHVYEKAGFKIVDTFTPKAGFFKNQKHYLMKYTR